MDYGGIASMLNNFNSIVNSQMMQARFSEQVNKDPGGSTQANNLSQALSSALSSLSGLLRSTSSSAISISDVTDSELDFAMTKLKESGASEQAVAKLVDSLSEDDRNLLYTKTGSDDPFLTIANRINVKGGDVEAFLNQATKLADRGEDINSYLEAATDVLTRADYDDFSRFLSVTNTVLNRNQDLGKFYDFTSDVLDERHYDMESNIFSVQTMLGYGADLDTAIGVMDNMETIGFDGRNNMVDLNRVTIDARKKGAYLPYVFDQMEKSGDTRKFLDDYMAANGMETTKPDFEKFDRIERIDGEAMTITEGESAALFGQAISNRHGLLPESVLYWSSLETGALDQGSSYLDLSTLKPGEYNVYVKIGNYKGGTDTATKKVIVLPKDGEIDEEVSVGGSGTKVKNNNGLGDTKDSDNTTKFIDDSNPGKGSHKASENSSKSDNKVSNNDKAQVNNIINSLLPNLNQDINTKEVKETNFVQPTKDISDIAKMTRLYEIFKDNVSANDVYDYLEDNIGKDKIVGFLNDNNQKSLAKKFQKRNVAWFDMMMAIGKDAGFYKKSTEQFRVSIDKSDALGYFKSKNLTNNEALESLWLLGYRDDVKDTEKVKSNNGLGDTKDSDNTTKFIDDSNPGKGNKKVSENFTKPVDEIKNSIKINQQATLKVTVEKGSAGLDSDLFLTHNGEDTLVTEKAQTNENITLERVYNKGDELDFFIRTHAESWGLGTYDHGTNKAQAESGKSYFQKEKIDENSYRIKFEDLPEERSDWDYNDVVIRIDIIPYQQESEKSNNGLGDTKDSDNTVKFVDDSNPGKRKKKPSKKSDEPKLLDNLPKNARSLSAIASERIEKHLSDLDRKKLDSRDLKRTRDRYLSKLFDQDNDSYKMLVENVKENKESDTSYLLNSFQQILNQIYGQNKSGDVSNNSDKK